MKTAIIILSDPKSGTDEALGRLFNALGAAYDLKQAGQEVRVVFQGAGTRWVAEVTRPSHPANGLYNAVADKIGGASCGCAEVFGATDDILAEGLDLIKDNPLPGSSGAASYFKLLKDGYQVINF